MCPEPTDEEKFWETFSCITGNTRMLFTIQLQSSGIIRSASSGNPGRQKRWLERV